MVSAGRPSGTVLVLAGTTEATELAGALVAARYDVESSLAGVTRHPRPRPGRVRVGGFGGPGGLADYLTDEGVAAVVDATHPFAARMPWHAAQACAAVGVPRCRVLRPPWHPAPGDTWHEVAAVENVPAALDRLGAERAFLAIGRQAASAIAAHDPAAVSRVALLRCVEPPDPPPPGVVVVLDRGPSTTTGDAALLREHRVDVVVAKNSGGSAGAAKLAAARDLGLPVVMIRRPSQPLGTRVDGVADAVRWCAGVHPASPAQGS